MIKLQTTQLPIKHTQGLNGRTGFGHSGFEMCSENKNNNVLDCAVITKKNTVNNFDKMTANNVSFRGLPFPQGSKLSQKAWKLAGNKTFNWLSDLAAGNQTVFDALFAVLITCGLRPAAIMAQTNENNKEKNKKAASHSIASGIIGYGFAVAVFTPIKRALDKVCKNPQKFAKNMEEYLTYGGKKLINMSDRTAAYKSIFNYGSQVFTASIRSAITIAMIPVIDKYVLNKIFGQNVKPTTKEELQNDPTYKFAYINFKNSPNAKKVFQNFAGVIK